MIKSRFIIGALLFAAVAVTIGAGAVAQEQSANPNMTPITAPGDYRFSFSHDGMTRFYLVHVPRIYRPGRATPMLIALHGGGGNADYQANDSKYHLISKSEQAG